MEANNVCSIMERIFFKMIIEQSINYSKMIGHRRSPNSLDVEIKIQTKEKIIIPIFVNDYRRKKMHEIFDQSRASLYTRIKL